MVFSAWCHRIHGKEETKVRLVQAQKAEEAKVRRREPGDCLAREWYNEEKETLDTRIYLLDSLLPTLIPGVENLLMEVERKHVLVSDQEPTRFNPINYLGEYLMRHNPQYNVPTKPDPYLREMKVVSEELKSLRQGTTSQRVGLINIKYASDGMFLIHVPMSYRLVQMRAEAKNKREEREEMERQKAEETARRKEVLAALFKEWTVDGTYRIPAALDKKDICPKTHDRKLKILNTLEKTVNLKEFTKVGVLDRQKILALLRDFYDRSPVIDEWEFWNPREWPIIELQDIHLMDFWGSLSDKEVCEELSENLVLSQTEVSEGEILGHEPVDDDRRETDRMSTSVTEGIAEATDLDGDTLRSEKSSSHEDTKTEREAEPGTVDRQDETLPGSASAENSLSIDGEPGSGKSEESILGIEPEIETKPEGDHTSATEPESGKSEESILGIEPEIETKPEGDHTSATEPGSEGQISQEDSAFVQLMDNFVGEDITLPTVKRLTAFIKQEYKQTEEEKKKQLEKVHRMAHMAQRKQLLEALFEKWDSNACGSLDLEEVVAVLRTFKEDMGKEALMKGKEKSLLCENTTGGLQPLSDRANEVVASTSLVLQAVISIHTKEQLCSRYPQLSKVGKLSPKAFQTFLELIASKSTGNEDETIDNLVRFLTTSVEQRVEQRVEQSHTQSLQSSARRKWLQDIQQAAETSFLLLLTNLINLYFSFAAIDQGKPIYVPRVQLHGNVHFWNSDRPVEESTGSLLVLPLYDAHWRVFGILGLDTLRDQCEKSIFLMHEITFYEGVCHAFSKAYHHICMQENVLQVAVTALDWLYPRTPSIHAVTTYLVAPGKDKDYALCKVITTDNTGQKEIHSSPVVLLREENLLRDYLFKCTDSSEVTLTSVYGEHHIAVPLHDLSRQTLGIFDVNIGQHKKLPPQEQKDLQKMLKMAQAACSEILQRSLEETEPTQVLEAERVANVRHAGILFHRFMLQELRECVRELSAESFAGIKSCAEPPALIHDVVKAVLLLLHPDWKDSEETESWSQCKLKLDDNLIQEIYCFDPTASSVQVQAELLLDLITEINLLNLDSKYSAFREGEQISFETFQNKDADVIRLKNVALETAGVLGKLFFFVPDVPQAAVWEQDSALVEYLYQWLHTCLALVEITKSPHTEIKHP
ncbi:hypothetical protein IHE44_0007441 [Lamprotornis superbus]|uniref:EF-hand domain-containing protein n=1 Tax=Lamprotornis superbus TaxID=245042 RepID=A0A835U130_9PASS|nr:hypothetical protein IHE44_0007441 [Lamprotornis superbus]